MNYDAWKTTPPDYDDRERDDDAADRAPLPPARSSQEGMADVDIDF